MDDLNTSDHLSLTVNLMYEVCSHGESGGVTGQVRVDWDQAQKSCLLEDFAVEVQHLF